MAFVSNTSRLATVAQPFVWLARKVWWFVLVLAGAITSLLRLGPLDLLKRCATVIISLTGLLALLWVGVQIVFPPIVITVGKLPEPLEKEFWFNTELSRALIDQLERIRKAVRDERSPSFEAVLNQPNIVVKTGDFSLNVQEQILGPLGTLLGRSPGEAHITVTCFHPACARTSDAECREIIPAPKPNTEVGAPVRQYLCLRAIVDIRRGAVQRRLKPQLALSNDTYDVEMTKQISRIAEAVTAVADPATAALYFYRRIQQEGEATRSVTNDPEVLVELRGEAFKAAEQAESHDTVSTCWAHSIRARLAIDRREFILAESYIARAKEIPRWRSTLTPDCQRLIAVTEMELARRLVLRAAQKRFPEHPDDRDPQRRLAAYDRVDRMLVRLSQVSASWAPALFGQYADQRDLIDALTLARAEIGISWFNVREQCRLMKGERPPPAQLIVNPAAPKTGEDDEGKEDEALRAQIELSKEKVWIVIQDAVKSIEALKPEERLTPLRRQAAIGFLQRISRDKDCLERTLDLAQRLYLNHPNDAEMTRVFAGLVESWALAADSDDRNTILDRARSIYERMVDMGDDKVDMFALSRLAFINAAFVADMGVEQRDYVGPNPEILRHVTRAWQRYQRALYPSDIRHHAEFMLSFWGSLLLLGYPDEVLDQELPQQITAAQPADIQVRSAIVRKGEFQQALQVLFPAAQPTRLADLPRLAGIGARITCFCLLTRMTSEGEGADFYMTKANKWQLSSPSLATCRRDLLPRVSTTAAAQAKQAFDVANEELNSVKAALEHKDDDAAADLQVTIEIMKAGLAEKEAAMKAASEKLAQDRKDLETKRATLAEADDTCRAPKRN